VLRRADRHSPEHCVTAGQACLPLRVLQTRRRELRLTFGPDTTYLGARYQRLAHRLGKKKAIVAVEHSILTAVWHMLTNDVDYTDLGGDYFARLDPQRAMRRIVRQANILGFTVRFDPIQAA